MGRGWIKKGKKKEIVRGSGGKRLNLLGAIDLEEKERPLMKEYETIDQDTVIDFIDVLEQKYK